MPVRKYRSIEEVPSNMVVEDPTAALRMAFSLSDTALRIAGWRPPSGVHKSRSLADAAALRDAWARSS
jgi:hypothetical protein